MRSPNWHEGELKLALDLYLSKDLTWLSRMSDSTFEIIAISKLLNRLDFYEVKPDNFRSTGSIRERIENMPSEVLDSYDRTKGAGSHAEIYAVNKLLLDNPNAQPSDIAIYVNRTLGTRV